MCGDIVNVVSDIMCTLCGDVINIDTVSVIIVHIMSDTIYMGQYIWARACVTNS